MPFAMSILTYFRHICNWTWIHTFWFAKTAPLETPSHFRTFPQITERECSHCFQCMMICPAPDAIEVLHHGDPPVYDPVIHPGHCIRCGLCIEACPEGVLTGGRVHKMVSISGTYMQMTSKISINPATCIGCGVCTVSCPVDKEIDPMLGAKGTTTTDEVVIRVICGFNTVVHNEKCTGCKTCEEQCPHKAIKVARILEPKQVET